MACEYFQVPASGQGSGKEGLNRLMRPVRIASVEGVCARHVLVHADAVRTLLVKLANTAEKLLNGEAPQVKTYVRYN